MFWERSDSILSDEILRGLKDIRLSCNDVLPTIRHLDGFGLSKLGDIGTFSRLFLFQMGPEMVARFNIGPSISTQSLHLEQWACNEAISHDFPTPRITYVDTSRKYSSYPYQIIEHVDGVSLRERDETTTCRVLVQLGKALAKLHTKPISGDRWGRVGLQSFPEWGLFWTYGMYSDARNLLELGLLTDDQFDQIYAIGDTDVRDWYTGSPYLLHADLSYDNVLLDRSTKDLKAVIDWEDAVLGDPIFELAGLATFHPESRHSSFLDSYYGGTERPEGFAHLFWLYYLRISLAKAVHRHRFGYESKSRTEGVLHPDDRIPLALERLKELT